MKRIFMLALLMAVGAVLSAQEPVDAVVAKVEDTAILKSEVDRQVDLYKMAGPMSQLPDDSLRKMALESLIETNLMLTKAKAESLAVADEEVEARLEKSIQNMRAQFPTEEAFQAQLKEEGLTLAQLKDKHRQDARSQLLIQKLIDRTLRPKVGEPTTKEMEQFYDTHRDSFPPEPEKVELSHILIVPKPGEQATRNFETKGRQVMAAIQAKKLPFATIAKRYSMDKGSAANGGELGWVTKDDLFPEIRDKIQKLRVGQVSEPIQSRVGIHFVKMLEKQGERMRLAHVLIFPTPTEADIARAKRTATGLRSRVTTGGEDFAKVAQTYSDDEENKNKGGSLGQMPVEAFGRYPEIRDELATLAPDSISEVLKSDTGFHVFKLHKRIPMQQPTYETVKPQLREYIMGKKMQELYETWMKELKKKYYVERM
jgi:peptidyl-prolyl cis-trans isomerase SurA